MNMHKLSPAGIINGVLSGSLRVVDIARQTLRAMNDHNNINAVINTSEERVMDMAQALDTKLSAGKALPLHGVPVLVKDNIDTVDFLTTGGTAALATHQPAADAGVITRLKNAGALIVGKANMHELAFGITSNNACTGAVHNPYNRDLIPGGSSGGSAAAVSAGIVPLALGSDTGGSSRIPAALCGVCGFRPSTGRYPGDGLINLSLTRDTVGAFARDVNGIVLIDKVLGGGCPLAQIDINQLRLAVPRDPFYRALEKDTAGIIEGTLELLREKGATLIEADMPELFTLNEKVSFPVAFYETSRELTYYLQRHVPGLSLTELVAAVKSPDVKEIMEALQAEQKIPEQVYQDAINIYRPQLQKMYAEYFKGNKVQAMLYPTTALTSRPIGDDETVELNGRHLPTFASYIRNVDPSSNAGIPSLSIPAGSSTAGLPVGLSIDGRVNCDAEVLSIGKAIAGLIPPIKAPPA